MSQAKDEFVRVGSGWTSKNKKTIVVKVNDYTLFINPNDYKKSEKQPDFFVSTVKKDQKALKLMDSVEYYQMTKKA